MATLSFVNTITGEQFEFPTDTAEDLVEAYKQADGLEKAAKRAKEKARDLIVQRDLDGFVYGDRQVKIINVQRQTYDLETMRNVLDEDLFNSLIQPDKTKVDNYIKEYVEVDPQVKELRGSMVDVGDPYIMVRVEKVQA